jgi:hypothetical protein
MSPPQRRDINAAAAAPATGGIRGIIAGKKNIHKSINLFLYFFRWYYGWY